MKNNNKINYADECYISPLILLIIYIIVLLIIFICGFSNGMIASLINGDISTFLFLFIALGPMLVVMYFLFNSYKIYKMKRNMNLYIMNNGVCIEGKVISIRHIYTPSGLNGHSGFHNTIADIQFTYNDIEQVLVVDHLLINEKDTKKYENKKVKVYIYNNMHYVDIIN